MSFVKVYVYNVHSVCDNKSIDASCLNFCTDIQIVYGSNVFNCGKGSEAHSINDLDNALVSASSHNVVFANVLSRSQIMRIVRVSVHLLDYVTSVVIKKLQISPWPPMCDHEFFASAIEGHALAADKNAVHGTNSMGASDVPYLQRVVPSGRYELVRVHGMIYNAKYPINMSVDFTRT